MRYTDAGNIAEKHCDDCSEFEPPGSPDRLPTCGIVEGPINPHGHCIAFSPKQR